MPAYRAVDIKDQETEKAQGRYIQGSAAGATVSTRLDFCESATPSAPSSWPPLRKFRGGFRAGHRKFNTVTGFQQYSPLQDNTRGVVQT